MQAEAAAFPGRRRSITWRDRSGLATLPRSDEEPSDLVSRERSYPGGLPDVHEEVSPQPPSAGDWAASSAMRISWMWSCVRAATQAAPIAQGGAAAARQIVCEEEDIQLRAGHCMNIAIVCDYICYMNVLTQMEMSEDQLGAHLNSRTGSLEE